MEDVIKIITIVTRTSKLALCQAEAVKQALISQYPQLSFKIIGIKTSGDKILTQTLDKIGGKGLFVKELEEQLLAGQADIAVHSMKDVPAKLPEQLTIAAMLPRADPYDVLLTPAGLAPLDLPHQALIGSSSLRRSAQILALRPDLTIKPLRGNVETRINKLLNHEYNAIILAKAGLDRLQLTTVPSYCFSLQEMLPAVGQGAIGVECRSSNYELMELLAQISDPLTWHCVNAERSMNAALNGSCSVPIAGYAEIIDMTAAVLQLKLTGMVAHADGSKLLFARAIDAMTQAQQLGRQVAEQLLQQGAQQIIGKYI